MKPDTEALRAEEESLKKLKAIIHLTTALLCQADITLSQAQKLVADAKARALELFPDKGDTFDLIYGTRLRRTLTERFHLQ